MRTALAKQPSAPSWTPRAERVDTDLSVDFHGPTTPAFRGRVRNLSASGMLIDAPGGMSVGDVLTARMPARGDVMCRVVRITSRGAGVRFVPADDDWG